MRGRKRMMCREAVMQVEGDEQGLTDHIEMRESTPLSASHSDILIWAEVFIGNRKVE
jgi:hypothetical protein